MKTITIRLFLAFLILSGTGFKAQAVSPPPDGGYAGGNTAEGQNALLGLTTGGFNTAIGWLSLKSDTIGQFNTGVGAGTLALNTGDSNTATGAGALLFNTTGGANTANGVFALLFNTTGNNNTASGDAALFHNTSGANNTAHGVAALFSNTTGNENTAFGSGALFTSNGNFNTAVGRGALGANTSGSGNSALGWGALDLNIGGNLNTATGDNALFNNTTGADNTASGAQALQFNATGSNNTANGNQALESNTSGSNNTALGVQAGFNATTGDGNVYIGAGMLGSADEVNHTYIRNINTTTVSGGGTDTVTVNLSNGLLGHLSSSRRYKEDVQPMNSASEALYRLEPVTFRYKKAVDPTHSSVFGLIAEDVAEVNPDLVACNAEGQPESVHYEMVNAMLLNEFLKEHRKIENLKNDFQATLAQQKKEIAALTAIVKEQSAQIQKVSAQLAKDESLRLADLK